MNKFKSFLIPQWLKDFDKQLLLHFPLLWASRIHFAAYFLFFYTLFGVGIVALAPVEASHVPDTYAVTIAIFFFALGGFLYWLYAQNKHISEYGFGKQHQFVSLGQVGLFVVSSLLFLLPFLFVHLTSKARIRAAVSREELLADIKALTEADAFSGENLEKLNAYKLPLAQVADSVNRADGDERYNYAHLRYNFYKPFDLSNDYKQTLHPYKNNYLEYKSIEEVLRLPKAEQIRIIDAFIKTMRKYQHTSVYMGEEWPSAQTVYLAAIGDIETPPDWTGTHSQMAKDNIDRIWDAHQSLFADIEPLWMAFCFFLAACYAFGLFLFAFRLLKWKIFMASVVISCSALFFSTSLGYSMGSGSDGSGVLLMSVLALIGLGVLGFLFMRVYPKTALAALAAFNFWSFIWPIACLMYVDPDIATLETSAVMATLPLIIIVLHIFIVLRNSYKYICAGLANPS